MPGPAWKNPRQSSSLSQPLVGTHDYIAFKGYVLAGRPSFIRPNLNAYFTGTEAPDNGLKPADAEGGRNQRTLGPDGHDYKLTQPCWVLPTRGITSAHLSHSANFAPMSMYKTCVSSFGLEVRRLVHRPDCRNSSGSRLRRAASVAAYERSVRRAVTRACVRGRARRRCSRPRRPSGRPCRQPPHPGSACSRSRESPRTRG